MTFARTALITKETTLFITTMMRRDGVSGAADRFLHLVVTIFM